MRAADPSAKLYPEVTTAANWRHLGGATLSESEDNSQPVDDLQQSGCMTNTTLQEKRLTQLRLLRDERFNGVTSQLAHALDRAPGYFSRVFRREKGIGEALCREIERKLHLPHLWLDGLADDETPPEASRNLIDADLLYRCEQVVDHYIAASPLRSADGLQRVRLACVLYSMFYGEDVTDEQLRRYLERWTVIMEAARESKVL